MAGYPTSRFWGLSSRMSAVMANFDQSGHWTDYIYAGTEKIAAVYSNPNLLTLSANGGGGGQWIWFNLTVPSGIPFRAGDKLRWRQRQWQNGHGGMTVQTDNGCSGHQTQ